MHFEETNLAGARLVDRDRIEDDYGFFARTFCARDSEKRGLRPVVAVWLSPEHPDIGWRSHDRPQATRRMNELPAAITLTNTVTGRYRSGVSEKDASWPLIG
jgi:hypothetical protein